MAEKKESKVSILIPVYNREKIIGETLHSAINQTYENIEVIVVDNASTDGTWDVCKSFASKDSRIRVYRNETNIGPVRNWKKCIDYSTGEYAKILWSDDLIAPTFIERTLPFLEGKDEVGFVFTSVEVFNDMSGEKWQSYVIGNTGIYKTSDFIEKELLDNTYPYSPGCALFRTKDLKQNLLVDIPNNIESDFSNHAIGNDLLIYLLTAKDYPKFAFIDETLSSFRVHDNSITITSNRARVFLLYFLAMAHFVERHVTNRRLIDEFNTRLFITYYRYKAWELGFRSVNDFYSDHGKYHLKLTYLLYFIVKRIIHKAKMCFN